MSFKDLMTYIRILVRHIYTSVISWCIFYFSQKKRHVKRKKQLVQDLIPPNDKVLCHSFACAPQRYKCQNALLEKRIQPYVVSTEAKLVIYAASIQNGEWIAQTCKRISPTCHVCSSFLLVGLQAEKFVDVLGIKLQNCQEILKKYALRQPVWPV